MRFAVALGLLLVPGMLLAADHDDTGIHTPDAMKWQDGPKSIPAGAKMAVLEGDPTKEGPFVMRIKMPDGYKVAEHTHPKTERVTIISGTLHIVMDDKAAQKMPAGSYGYWAAGMKHHAWTEGETIIQVHGVGPWAINYVNPADDPRNK